jgi:pimeloyl-ACP methyl ester carboxylesterase
MRVPLAFSIVSFLLAAVMSGCASLPSSKIDNVNNQRTEYALIIKKSPVVIFENGLGAHMLGWNKVFTEIGKEATVFAYNRPGYGKSDMASTPRDGARIVDELRANLQSKGLQPPYVLVGHSLGGLYVQLFARKYPDDVVGLVLVDSTHPTQFEGIGSKDNWPWWFRVMIPLFMSRSQNEELAAAMDTGQQVLHAPTFSGKPVIVLSAIDNSESELGQFVKAKRMDLPRLYPGSTQTWVESGHFIQRDKPEAVIQAVRAVLDNVGRSE